MSLNWLFEDLDAFRWQRLFSLLSTDLFEFFGTYLGIPIPSDKLRAITRQSIEAHPSAYRRTGEFLAAEAFPEILEMVKDGLRRVSTELGEAPEGMVRGWVSNVWSGLNGAGFDWFGYQVVFSRWGGKIRHSGVDIFGLGPSKAPLRDAFIQYYIEPIDRFNDQVEQARRAVLSPWDSQILQMARLTWDDEPPESWTDLSTFVDEPARRNCFQQFWLKLVEILDMEQQARIHASADEFLRETGNYPATRRFPLPSELRPR